jgi:hypothetical protein
MSSQFAARSLRLDQLFSDPVLIEAAPYQRSYAWTAEEAGRLLEDIVSALDAEGDEAADYFLGTLLFIDPDRRALNGEGWPLTGPARTFEVVDGLQRLTTLTILYCALRDLDEDEGVAAHAGLLRAIQAGSGAKVRNRLALRGRDEDFFQRHVRSPGGSRIMPDGELSPAETRILAVREHFLTALFDFNAAQRRRLADFLLERCSVVLAATVGIDRAHRMFTVLNDTGKPLARNDILKAELLGNVSAQSQTAACATWDELDSRFGSDFESLFSHVRAMYGRPGSHIIAGIRTVAAETGGAEKFIAQVLQPAAGVFDDLRHARHSGATESASIVRMLTYLQWLSSSDWVPPAMLWRLGKGKDPAQLAWFLQALDRLTFGLRILGLGGSRRMQRFGAVVNAIRNGADLKAAGGPLDLSRDELRSIDHNLRDLHARSAPVSKLVLMRLNDEISGGPQNLTLDEFTVEHVLPRKHGAGSRWRVAFPDPQAREHYTEALGNLVLITKAQNDKAGNLEFTRKYPIYFPAGASRVPGINEAVRRQKDWTPREVLERDTDLMRRLQMLWGFGSGESRLASKTAEPDTPQSARRRRVAQVD